MGQSSISSPVLALEPLLCTGGCSAPTHRLTSALAPLGTRCLGAQRLGTSTHMLSHGCGSSQAFPESHACFWGPWIPCPHVEALTCSLGLHVLCAPEFRALALADHPLDPCWMFTYRRYSSRPVKELTSLTSPPSPKSQERDHVCPSLGHLPAQSLGAVHPQGDEESPENRASFFLL